MKGIGKATLLTVAVALVLVVGVGSALAAGGPGRGAGAGYGPGYGQGVMAGGVVMDAAAQYIGVTETALAAERHDGKSLAQIATAHGKTVSGLETALVTAFKANLDKAVAAGRLTEAQATQVLANFKAQVSVMVQRTATGPMNGAGRMLGVGGGGHCRWAP